MQGRQLADDQLWDRLSLVRRARRLFSGLNYSRSGPETALVKLKDDQGRHRVVVTGFGLVTCVGLDAPETWTNLTNGRSGIRRISIFDDEGEFPIKVAAQIPNFDAQSIIGKLVAADLPRFVTLGIAATMEALRHANLNWRTGDVTDAAVIMGNGHCDLAYTDLTLKVNWRMDPSFMVPQNNMERLRYDSLSGGIGRHFHAYGPRQTISTACCSGAKSIERASRFLSRGQCQIAIAGGSEAVVDPYGIRFLHAMRALTTHNTDPHHASKPFDRTRSGFVIGEGSGVLVLETLDHAIKRNAPIHAEVVGVGGSANGTSLYTPDPEGEGSAQAMRAAIRYAGISPREIDTIFAHATATDTGDPAEALAIRSVFGDHAPKLAITAPKSMLGHAIGASGAIAGVNSVQAIMHSLVPPVTNLNDPDPCIDGLNVVRGQSQSRPVRCVLSNAFGFGGVNGCTIFRRFTE